jgi:hypothetical protein
MPVAQEAPIQLGAGGNFNNSMMQQMSAASQGMFPMMNPALWNIPMGAVATVFLLDEPSDGAARASSWVCSCVCKPEQ